MSHKCGERLWEQMCRVLSSQENHVSASLIYYFWLRWVFTAACGPSLVEVCRFLPAVASRCRAQAPGHMGSMAVLFQCMTKFTTKKKKKRIVAQGLSSCGFVVAHEFSYSAACGIFIFLDQGLNPCPPHWRVDSYPLDSQKSPMSTSKQDTSDFSWSGFCPPITDPSPSCLLPPCNASPAPLLTHQHGFASAELLPEIPYLLFLHCLLIL